MANAAGSQYALHYIAESTWGTTPGTPQMAVLRNTGCSLELKRALYESKEIRSDRMIADARLGAYSVGGDIDFELSMGGQDDLLESALFGAWNTNVLKAGVTRKSFTIEKGFTDIAQYHDFTGCVVDKFSLSMKPGQMVTGKFSILGKTMTTASSPLDATPTAAATNLPMSCAEGSISEGGSPIAIITALDFTLDNQLQLAEVLASNSPVDAVAGRAKLTGTLSALFASNALLTKFLNETRTSISVVCGTTKTFTFDISEVLYTGGKVDVSTEGLLALNMPFVGLHDTSDATCLKITRVP